MAAKQIPNLGSLEVAKYLLNRSYLPCSSVSLNLIGSANPPISFQLGEVSNRSSKFGIHLGVRVIRICMLVKAYLFFLFHVRDRCFTVLVPRWRKARKIDSEQAQRIAFSVSNSDYCHHWFLYQRYSIIHRDKT